MAGRVSCAQHAFLVRASHELITKYGTDHGFLSPWAGTIAVLNLGYVPVVGDSFVVAIFDERLDDSKFSLPVVSTEFGSGVEFEAIYHEHDVTLTVTAVPEPESWAMLLAGLGLMGAVARRRRT